MSKKQRKHQNVHGRGGGGSPHYSPHEKKPSDRLRKVSSDAGAEITDNPPAFLIYTGIVLVFFLTLKLIFKHI